MPAQPRPGKFVVYAPGHRPDQLCLGHLVVDNYGEPLDGEHCSFPQLDADRLREWASLEEDKDVEYTVELEGTVSGEVDAAIGKFGGGIQTGSRIFISASRSRRWTLREPDKFLDEMLLQQSSSKEALRRWVTLTNSEYLLKKFSGRRPRIWLLTGLIEIENATVTTSDGRSPSGTVGFNTGLLTLPAGCSAGVSASFRSGYKSSQKATYPDVRIYAAQYQMLGINYVKISNKKGTTTIPALPCVKLGNIFSIGSVKGGGGSQEPNAAVLACKEDEGIVDHEPLGEEYWTEFKKVAEDYIE